jgi:hypothetical protein
MTKKRIGHKNKAPAFAARTLSLWIKPVFLFDYLFLFFIRRLLP